MAKPWAIKFYNSKAWKQCKNSYINTVHGLCEKCLRNGKHTPGWIVHHKIKLTATNINNPEVSLNHEHLEYLCQECHNAEHGTHNEVTRDGLMFNEFGELMQCSDTNG